MFKPIVISMITGGMEICGS